MLNTKSPCAIQRELQAAYLTAVEKVGVAQRKHAEILTIGMAGAVRKHCSKNSRKSAVQLYRDMPNTVNSTPAKPRHNPLSNAKLASVRLFDKSEQDPRPVG